MAKKAMKKSATKTTKRAGAGKSMKTSTASGRSGGAKTAKSAKSVKSSKRKAGARTTMRSRAGTKLYVKRSASGQFKDIQTYKRAHGSDIKRRAKDEVRKGDGPADSGDVGGADETSAGESSDARQVGGDASGM